MTASFEISPIHPPFWIRLRLLFHEASLMVAEGIGIERATDSRETRFRQVLSQHGELVSAICFSFANRRNEFEDLRQDALVNIWKGLTGFNGASDIKTWIYRVTLNTCVSIYRKSSTQPADFDSLENVAGITADGLAREEVDYLHTLISMLTPEDKGIILMWLDSHSYDEIAEVMELKRNTVATRIHRIREKLKTFANNSKI